MHQFSTIPVPRRILGPVLVAGTAAVVGCAQLAGYEEYSFDRTSVDASLGGSGGSTGTGGQLPDGGMTGGASGLGGSNTGGAGSGGSGDGGSGVGGSNTGGSSSGGSGDGGSGVGGSNTGGSSTGGSGTGGSNSGGSGTGGSSVGGSNTGGSGTGGSSTGGSGTGGSNSGGSGTGGSSGGGSVWDLSTVPSSCPPSSGGPALVPIRGGYCIDRTEVTRTQYEAWLATNPSTDGQIALCQWNTDFTPAFWCLANPAVCKTDCGEHPQVCVDWCDAYAYCKAVGKRLCGRIGGGTNYPGKWNDAKLSEYFNACSSGGLYDFPYSDTLDAQVCNGKDKGIGSTVPVGSLPSCQSPQSGYAGVMDLSGNAVEWEDSCVYSTGASDPCYLRGGGFADDIALYCDSEIANVRSDVLHSIGFRCCSP